jgi:hypothetical protein
MDRPARVSLYIVELRQMSCSELTTYGMGLCPPVPIRTYSHLPQAYQLSQFYCESQGFLSTPGVHISTYKFISMVYINFIVLVNLKVFESLRLAGLLPLVAKSVWVDIGS